ncbi:MAG: hypothetical protein AAF222_10420 [Pseudomonadota bacterium]
MKDTYEAHDPIRTEAVLAYEAKVERKRQQQERDGVAVMSVFLPLVSAADPSSPLGRFTRWAPVFVIGLIASFAAAVALGIV